MNSGCSVQGCHARHKARGYCILHYRRWARHGTAEPTRARATVCINDGCGGTPVGTSAHCHLHEQERRRARDAYRFTPEGRVEAAAKAKRRLDVANGTRPRQRDKGFEAYVADRRTRGVPIEGLPTYTLLPLLGQLEAIDAMRMAG